MRASSSGRRLHQKLAHSRSNVCRDLKIRLSTQVGNDIRQEVASVESCHDVTARRRLVDWDSPRLGRHMQSTQRFTGILSSDHKREEAAAPLKREMDVLPAGITALMAHDEPVALRNGGTYNRQEPLIRWPQVGLHLLHRRRSFRISTENRAVDMIPQP